MPLEALEECVDGAENRPDQQLAEINRLFLGKHLKFAYSTSCYFTYFDFVPDHKGKGLENLRRGLSRHEIEFDCGDEDAEVKRLRLYPINGPGRELLERFRKQYLGESRKVKKFEL